MYLALDGPAIQGNLSVGTVTVVEAKVGATSFVERQVITMQPSGNLYVYFANDGEVPTAVTVAANGFLQFKSAKESYEAGPMQKVYLLSAAGTISVKIAERT